MAMPGMKKVPVRKKTGGAMKGPAKPIPGAGKPAAGSFTPGQTMKPGATRGR